jgi:hypothetical protein
MGRNVIPVELHEGGDAMLMSRNGVIKFYEELIARCKNLKGRWTSYGFKIDDKFIKGLQVRLDELNTKF